MGMAQRVRAATIIYRNTMAREIRIDTTAFPIFSDMNPVNTPAIPPIKNRFRAVKAK
jgi:hypothetical protein